MNTLLSLERFNDALQQKGWTMKRLAEEYDQAYPNKKGTTIYNTLRKWNSGKGNPTLEKLVRVCDSLGCDVDFLIDRMDEHTHTNQFIHDQTNLSEKAVNKLLSFKEKAVLVSALEFLLCSEDFEKILTSLYYMSFFNFTLWHAVNMPENDKDPKLSDDFAEYCMSQSDFNELQLNKAFVHIAENIKDVAMNTALETMATSTGSKTFEDSVKAFKEIRNTQPFSNDSA